MEKRLAVNVPSIILLCLLLGTIVQAQQYDKLELLWTSDKFLKNITTIATYKNEVWVGTESGCFLIDSNDKMEQIPGIKENITTLRVDNDGGVWLGTFAGKLLYVEDKKIVYDTLLHSSKTTIRHIIPLDTTVLIAADGLGIVNFHKKKGFIGMNRMLSLPIHFLFVDKDDNRWIGTSNGMLCENIYGNKVKEPFGKHTYKATTTDSLLLVFHLTNGKTAIQTFSWVGDKATKQKLELPKENNMERTNSIMVDHNKRLWIASNSANIRILNIRNPKKPAEPLKGAAKISEYTHNHQATSVVSMAVDADSNVWIATNVGLFKFGVPKPIIAPIDSGYVDTLIPDRIVLSSLRFGLNDSIIDVSSRLELETFAKRVQKDTTIHMIIEGHTASAKKNEDTDVSKLAMQQLSEARARAVANYLYTAGIERNRIKTIGYGYTKLANPDDVSSEKNRRVEIQIIRTR